MPAGYLYFLISIPAFFLFAWIIRRALGLKRLALWRTLVAALVGVVAGDVIGRVLWDRVDSDIAIAAGIALGIIASMLAILAMEALFSSAHTHRGNLLQRTRRRWRQALRSAQIARIASSHGLRTGADIVFSHDISATDSAAYGRALRETMEEAGGVFVKFGQVLANHPDLFPAGVADELELLQHSVAPESRATLEPTLAEELGRPISEVFSEFDWDPIGAASIGQVHRATLTTGEQVVVKIRRTGIRSSVERDLDIALDLASAAESRSDRARGLAIREVVEQFGIDLREELDFRIEARNTREIAETFERATHIVVPKIFDDFTSEGVIVQQFMPGEPLTAVHHTINEGDAIASELFRTEVQAMLDGLRFHADPHPGNLLVRDDGTIALVDFGSAGKLDMFERGAVTDILSGLALNDPTMLRSATLQVCVNADDVDPSALDRAFARLMADQLGPGAAPNTEMLKAFLRVAADFSLTLPSSVSQMLRALATLQSSLELLSPGFPIIEAATDLASAEVSEALDPENLAHELKREAVRLAPVLRRAPYHLDRIADQLETGNLGFKLSFFNDDHEVQIVSRMVNRAVLAFIGGMLGIVSTMMFAIDSEITISDNLTLFDLLGFVGIMAGATLTMRVVLEILRD